MHITVKMLPGKTTKNIELQNNATVMDLLNKIKVKPDTVVVLRQRQPIPVDDTLKKDEELSLLQVASGG